MDIKALVKELNARTGAGLMDCKKALMEANGDVDAAEKALKEKGLAAVTKRAERATSEGRIFVRVAGNKIAVAEITCETDFVAKAPDFIAAGEKVLDVVLEKGYTKVEDELKALVTDLAARIRENMNLTKVLLIDAPADCAAATYVHSDFKTGAVVVIKGSNADSVKEFAKDCCLHLAAFTPSYMTRSDVPESYITEQKEIFQAQMDADEKMASKPQNVKDGILNGKINKHLAEICFVDQMFVKDDKKSVTAKMDEVAKAAGCKLEFASINLLVLGK